LSVPGVEFVSSDEIRDAVRQIWDGRLSLPQAVPPALPEGRTGGLAAAPAEQGLPGRWVDIPPYQGDVLVRGSDALAKTKDGRLARDVM
jgi:hypothetical protein